MQQMIPMIVAVGALGLLIGLMARSAVQRGARTAAQRSRRGLTLHAGAMFMCAAFLIVNAITSDRLRYLNVAVAVLSLVAGIIELRKVRRQRHQASA